MGCAASKEHDDDPPQASSRRSRPDRKRPKRLRRVVWTADKPMTEEDLARLREEFWDTQPHYGGSREYWDALKAATASDPVMALAIIEAAAGIVPGQDLSLSYDERGFKYELPNYVLSDPLNLAREGKPGKPRRVVSAAAPAAAAAPSGGERSGPSRGPSGGRSGPLGGAGGALTTRDSVNSMAASTEDSSSIAPSSVAATAGSSIAARTSSLR